MTKLLYLLLIFTSFAYGSVRTLESISYRHEVDGTTLGFIHLNDGSMWKWYPDLYSANLLRNWKVGEKIFVETNHCPGFFLYNPEKPHFRPNVALSFQSYEIFPHIVQIASRSIKLSDSSEWKLMYEFNRRTISQWSLGDQIIPICGKQGHCELVNIDVPYDNRSQIERYIEVKSCAECTKQKEKNF